MSLKGKSRLIFFLVVIFAVVLLVCELEARGRRGGGRRTRSFSRSGIARSGSMSGMVRHSRPVSKPETRPAIKTPSWKKTAAGNGSMMNRKSVNRSQQTGKITNGSRLNRKDRQEWLDEHREDIQEEIHKRQEDRQEFIEEQLNDHYHDRYHYGWGHGRGVAVGVVVGATAATTTYVATLPCQAAAVVVNGITYFQCGTTWYQRAYAGSQVTYMITEAPTGY